MAKCGPSNVTFKIREAIHRDSIVIPCGIYPETVGKFPNARTSTAASIAANGLNRAFSHKFNKQGKPLPKIETNYRQLLGKDPFCREEIV